MHIDTIFNSCKRRFRCVYNSLKAYKNGGGKFSLLWSLRHIHIYATDISLNIRTKNLKDVDIWMYGNGHRLIIEESVVFKSGTIWFEDNNCQITIGKNTTIEEAHLAAAEDGMRLSIGEERRKGNALLARPRV